mmetsp:Transcript_11545/g.35686  ORF Transcript_11545/g.35686 Transcript_11545/m.35686 type:complete len:182 (+) Transcript_11545:179-724(+)
MRRKQDSEPRVLLTGDCARTVAAWLEAAGQSAAALPAQTQTLPEEPFAPRPARLGLGAKPPRGTVASAGEMQLKDKIQKEAQRDQKRKRDGGGRTHAAHEPGQVVGKHPSPHKLLGAQSTEPGFQYGAPKHGAFGVQGTQWVQAGASGGTHGSGIPAGKAESESDEEEGRASRFKKKASVR